MALTCNKWSTRIVLGANHSSLSQDKSRTMLTVLLKIRNSLHLLATKSFLSLLISILDYLLMTLQTFLIKKYKQIVPICGQRRKRLQILKTKSSYNRANSLTPPTALILVQPKTISTLSPIQIDKFKTTTKAWLRWSRAWIFQDSSNCISSNFASSKTSSSTFKTSTWKSKGLLLQCHQHLLTASHHLLCKQTSEHQSKYLVCPSSKLAPTWHQKFHFCVQRARNLLISRQV